jgi:hypothetical protein
MHPLHSTRQGGEGAAQSTARGPQDEHMVEKKQGMRIAACALAPWRCCECRQQGWLGWHARKRGRRFLQTSVRRGMHSPSPPLSYTQGINRPQSRKNAVNMAVQCPETSRRGRTGHPTHPPTPPSGTGAHHLGKLSRVWSTLVTENLISLTF